MKILIYGLNFSPELTGIGKYTGDMAGWLKEEGHDVVVVTAPPYYPEWRIAQGYSGNTFKSETINGIKVHRCPLWVPRKLSTLKRIFHLTTFAVSSGVKLFGLWIKGERPDVVVTVVPTMMCTPSALLFSMLTKAKSWLHFQDFEVDAMFAMGMASKGSRFNQFVYAFEGWLIAGFDQVSTISNSMLSRLIEKRGTKECSMLLPNWADVDAFSLGNEPFDYRKEWGLFSDDFVILYSGNMGEKQGLSLVLEAALKLKDESKIKFIFVGEGGEKQHLVETANDMGLSQIQFHPLQPLSRLPDLLSMADLHLVVQRKDAADLVMPSKVTGIFSSSGHALITAATGTELSSLVESNPGIATLIEPENLDVMVETIQRLFESNQSNSLSPNEIARGYAESNLKKDVILTKMCSRLSEISSNNT